MENDFLVNGTVFVKPIYLYIVCVPIFQSFLQNEITFISYLRAFSSVGYDVNICLYINEYHKWMKLIILKKS